MNRRAELDALTLDQQQAAYLALKLRRCFPCGGTCTPAGFGVFTHPSSARSMVYPMCSTCASDWERPAQRQAVAEATHRRFVKLGEVTP